MGGPFKETFFNGPMRFFSFEFQTRPSTKKASGLISKDE